MRSIDIRRALPDDARACGQICYEAFATINTVHAFPPDLRSPEVATRILSWMFSHPGFYCVVAESDGHLLGSNCLDERSNIASIGPITVHPEAQNCGIGRQLMETVLERAREQNFAGVRLVQAAFHNRSLCLYSSLGFAAREPLSVMQKTRTLNQIEGYLVRPVQHHDVGVCDHICRQVHGYDRHSELADAMRQGTAMLVEFYGKIIGYATALAFFGHAVAESNRDLQALISSAESFEGAGILVPTRNTPLLQWCLENGLRIVEPMTLMSLGLYSEPAGAYLPSIGG